MYVNGPFIGGAGYRPYLFRLSLDSYCALRRSETRLRATQSTVPKVSIP